MKKLLTFALTLILVSALVLPVSAGDADYDEAELKQLLTDAHHLYVSFYTYVEETACDRDSDFLEIVKNPYPDKENYPYKYFRRADEFQKWNDFIVALNVCFDAELAEKFVYCAPVAEVDGYTYSEEGLLQVQNEGVHLNYHNYPNDEKAMTLDESFKIVQVTENLIVAKFDVYDSVFKPEETTYTVEYTKTDAGWRISGGSFFDKYIKMSGLSPNYAPQTSLTTAVYAAVAALALGVVVVKKKRG